MNRRQFNKLLGSSLALTCLGSYGIVNGKTIPLQQPVLPTSFDEIDHFHITHKLRDGHPFPVPKPSIYKDIVIVGGGISGLTALYRLSDFNCLLLDKEIEVGGNSRRRTHNGIQYPLGAVVSQGPIEPFSQYFNELGVEFQRIHSPELAYYVDGKMTIDPLGDGAGKLPFEPQTQQAFANLKSFFQPYLDPKQGIYFPYMDNPPQIRQLDKITLWQFYEQFGFPQEVRDFMDCIVSSRLGCNGEKVSALVGVYLLSTFTAPSYTLPGGHGEITHKLLQGLGKKADNFIQKGITVTRVQNQDDGRVWVTAVRENGEVFTVSAASVIVATPKVITKHIVADLEDEKKQALNKFTYNAYLVGQVSLKEAISPAFELVSKDLFSRFIVQPDWIENNKGINGRSHLTVYIPFPGHHGRYELFTARAQHFAQKIYDDINTLFGNKNDVVEKITLHRWGHPMVIPTPGMQNTLEISREPLGNIIFAHSDTFGVSGLYSAVWTGMDAYSEALLNFVE